MYAYFHSNAQTQGVPAPVWVGSGSLLPHCQDATFHVGTICGPFTPAVVTEDHEIHNICNLLTLCCATDLISMCQILTNACSALQLKPASVRNPRPPWSCGLVASLTQPSCAGGRVCPLITTISQYLLKNHVKEDRRHGEIVFILSGQTPPSIMSTSRLQTG